MKHSLLLILRASAVLLLPMAIQPSALASITINISQPVAGATKAQTLVVQASVSSLYELASVTAALPFQETDLVYSLSGAVWTNTMSLLDLGRGNVALTVTAQDIFGNTAEAQRVFFVDNPPVLNVVAPLNGTVAQSQVYVEATATDDDPAGVLIYVYGPYGDTAPPLLSGRNSVRGFVAPNGIILFVAIDSAHQVRFVGREIFSELSSNLVETATAPGIILDATADRLLYHFDPDAQLTTWPPPPTAI